MPILFRTDGVRGEANTELTADLALELGRAAALVLGHDEWFVGWDTRVSSPMLVGAFGAGVASAGGHITQLGAIPTAGVALVCRNHGRPGAMVTASHNGYADNGIKIFGPDGVKLSDEIENEIEGRLLQLSYGVAGWAPPRSTGVVRWDCPPEIEREYRDWLIARARGLSATSLRFALDCANGAAYKVAPVAMKATGAHVVPIADQPDGFNINLDCGSTHLGMIRECVARDRLDFGLALDGDADRLLAIDEQGNTVDGDEIIALLARRRARLGALPGNGVVVTEWSNLGLLRSLRADGIRVEVCEVGDKFVARAMERTGFALGGEQSGHIIMQDLLPVGDGISTAIELVGAIVEAGLPLSRLCAQAMNKRPQVTVPVDVALPPAQVVSDLADMVEAENARLGESGRLILRASGTERVVRVMAEAERDDLVSKIVNDFVSVVSDAGMARPT